MMQKFCISNRWLENCGCRNSARPFFHLIHYFINNKWMMQKFCISNRWLANCGCRNSAWPYFPLNSLPHLQQMNDAEILHLKSVSVAWKLWMQKFCITFFRLIHYLIYNKWMMQKFCISNQRLEKCGCRNSAWPYFPLNLLPYLQQMNDAEILHLKSVSVAWKLWMQKFCMTFIPLNSLRFLQQMNNTEILHLKSVASKIWMQKICTTFFPLTAVI